MIRPIIFVPALVIFFFISLVRHANAQFLFQNSNGVCEEEPVLCASGGCISPDVVTISCRNIASDGIFTPAQFTDNNGFPDCVAARQNQGSSPNEVQASVLINREGGATACTPGPGDQFFPSVDLQLSGMNPPPNVISNVAAGQLNNVGFSDFTISNNNTSNMVSAPNSGSGASGFGNDGDVIATSNATWLPPASQFAFPSVFGERSMVLLDCDGMNGLDAVIAVQESQIPPITPPLTFRLNVLQNNGSGLQPITGLGDSFDTNVLLGTDFNRATLTVGDFNGDDILDVAAALHGEDDGGPVSQVITTCINDGSCNFACPVTPTIDLTAAHPGNPGDDIFPTSVEAGDFDGDPLGTIDLVVTEPFVTGPAPTGPGIHYYFNAGNNTFPTNLHQNFDDGVQVLTTGCYNNDNVIDVAVTNEGEEFFEDSVGVFTSNANGGAILPPVITVLSTIPGPDAIAGIDTADFDQQGGDDIIILDSIANPQGQFLRRANIYMNVIENFMANAGVDEVLPLNTPTVLAGASCTVNPDDPTNPTIFEIQWSIAPAVGATLTNPNQFDPTFNATSPGTYTLTLQCRSRCTTIVSDTKQIIVPGPTPTPSPTPTASPVPTPTMEPILANFTQGGCLASLHGNGSGNGIGWAIAVFLLYALRRWKR